MKYNQVFSLFCIIYIIISGCSVPRMVLKHEGNIDSTYESKGLLKVDIFIDNRPDEERDENQIAVNSLSPQIWSGSTSPEQVKQKCVSVADSPLNTNCKLISYK